MDLFEYRQCFVIQSKHDSYIIIIYLKTNTHILQNKHQQCIHQHQMTEHKKLC